MCSVFAARSIKLLTLFEKKFPSSHSISSLIFSPQVLEESSGTISANDWDNFALGRNEGAALCFLKPEDAAADLKEFGERGENVAQLFVIVKSQLNTKSFQPWGSHEFASS